MTEDLEKNAAAGKSMERLLRIMTRLRSGCPWDARQTHETLRRYLLEESYEVLEAIDHGDNSKLASELGDLLLQIVFHSEIASEKGGFDFREVANRISEKLIERHPHVFGDTKVHTAEDVQKNWEETKLRKEKRDSLLSGIPAASPALLQAQRLQERAATVGFEWDDVSSVIDKLREEMEELEKEIQSDNREKIEQEFGDILFTIVNMCRYYDVSAEDALRKTSRKFVNRFRYIERQYNDPQDMKSASLHELDAFWEEAKKHD
jgi:MazG family protein